MTTWKAIKFRRVVVVSATFTSRRAPPLPQTPVRDGRTRLVLIRCVRDVDIARGACERKTRGGTLGDYHWLDHIATIY